MSIIIKKKKERKSEILSGKNEYQEDISENNLTEFVTQIFPTLLKLLSFVIVG